VIITDTAQNKSLSLFGEGDPQPVVNSCPKKQLPLFSVGLVLATLSISWPEKDTLSKSVGLAEISQVKMLQQLMPHSREICI